MQCLIEDEVANWLNGNCVTFRPYESSRSPEQYLQFRAPVGRSAIELFVRSVLESNRGSGHFLIHLTDWSLYTAVQMQAVDALRSVVGETRSVIEAPGHLFSSDEHELATRLFGLATGYGWSSYLYFPANTCTIFNWEGELYDFWTCDQSRLATTSELVVRNGLAITCAGR
jgi:hypothetical protein